MRYKKISAIVLIALLSTTVAAQSVDQEGRQPVDLNDDGTIGPTEIPAVEGKPATMPGKGFSSIGKVLPGSAGSTAQQVLNVIDTTAAGLDLGNALSDLLGNQTQG